MFNRKISDKASRDDASHWCFKDIVADRARHAGTIKITA